MENHFHKSSRREKNIKESVKENSVIFSLLLSLTINKENKRERKGKSYFVLYLCNIGFLINHGVAQLM